MVEMLGRRYSEPVAFRVLKEYVEIARFCFADDHEVEDNLLEEYGPSTDSRPRPPYTPSKQNKFWVNRRLVHF